MAEATYWLGVSHTALRQYDAAIDIHRRFVEQFPDHHFAPEALRNIGNCQRDLGQMDQAKTTYKRLIKLYPKSDSAQKARQQLAKCNTPAGLRPSCFILTPARVAGFIVPVISRPAQAADFQV